MSQCIITAFKHTKNDILYLGHLLILRCQVWVNILKEKRKKPNERLYQSIHIDNRGINQYCICDFWSIQVSCIKNQHFYEPYCVDKKNLNYRAFEDAKSQDKDDELFGDTSDIFDVSKSTSNFITPTYKSSKAQSSFNKSSGLLFLSDIPDFVEDEVIMKKIIFLLKAIGENKQKNCHVCN